MADGFLASRTIAGRRQRVAPSKAVWTDKSIFSLVVGAVLAVLVLPPLVLLLRGSFTHTASNGVTYFTAANFAKILSQRSFIHSASNSLLFALGSSALALVIGGGTAWLVERTNTPGKALAYVTTIVSLGTPYILYTSAWLLLLENSGPINAGWRALTGSSRLFDVFGLPGMIFIEGLLWSPLVFLLLGATLRNANPELEEAARMSGAKARHVFGRITFRLALPALLALTLLVFIRALESFEVPALVGSPGRVHVLATDIYNTMELAMPPDLGGASALAVLLLMVVMVLLVFYGRLTRSAEKFATITGKGFRPRQIDLGGWRWLGTCVLVMNFLLLLVLPMLILLWASLLPFYEPFSIAALSHLTSMNYRHVLHSSRYLSLLENTLIIAAVAASAVMAIAATAAWLSVRRAPGARIVDNLATLPLVFPGIVLGVAVMQVFLAAPIGLYGTIWIIVWAFVINYMPYGVRYSFTGMLQVHRELEEAASIAGGGPLVTFRRVVVPLLAPSLIAGWLFVFLMSTRVLALPVLLSAPNSQTMAVAMFDLWGNGQGPELAALGLIWSVAMAAVALGLYAIGRRSGIGLLGQD